MVLTIATVEAAYEKGDYKRALSLIEELEELGIVHPDILVWKGRCLQLVDKTSYGLSDIENTFKEALSLDPDYVPAIVELAWFYLNVYDDAQRAGVLFERAFGVVRETLAGIVKGMAKTLSETEGKREALEYLSKMKHSFLQEEEVEELKGDIMANSGE